MNDSRGCSIVNLRDSVLIRKNAIGSDALADLLNQVHQAPMKDSAVSNFDEDVPDDAVEWIVDKKIRNTQDVRLSDETRERSNRILDASARELINPFYGVEVRDWEPLQVLHYGAGGHYIAHVDAETLYKDDLGRDFWEKTLDRDLSVVYFLNADFVGGELVFPDIGLTITPEAGMLVCFPSDHHFVHGVNPVQSGRRYTMVTWLRVKGMPTLEEINRMNLDEYERARPRPIEQAPRIRRSGVAENLE